MKEESETEKENVRGRKAKEVGLGTRSVERLFWEGEEGEHKDHRKPLQGQNVRNTILLTNMGLLLHKSPVLISTKKNHE